MPPAVLQVVASGVVDKYIGESARVIREMFRCGADGAANDPCELPVARGGSVVGHGHAVSADVRVDSRYLGWRAVSSSMAGSTPVGPSTLLPAAAMRASTSPASSSWTRLMPSAASGSARAPARTARCGVRGGSRQAGAALLRACLLHVCSACCGTCCLRDWLLKPSVRPQLCCRRCNER